MGRYRRSPLTLAQLLTEGPPVRVSDLSAVSGLAPNTIKQDIALGVLPASKRGYRQSRLMIQRPDAVRWLHAMGIARASA